MEPISKRRIVAGFDGGGSKTECWVADVEGRVLGRGIAGGANLLATERDRLVAAVRESLSHALAEAGRAPGDLRAACIALAGYWSERSSSHIAVEELRGVFPEGVRVRLEPDVAAALQSAASEGPAIVLVAGTGSIAFGRNAKGIKARAGGWGHLLGDEGSSYWIGLQAIRASLRHADGRERETLLAGTIPAAFGCAAPGDLVALAHLSRRMGKREIAALAPLVARAAEDGDVVACEIINDAAGELALLVGAVACRLGMADETFPVVVTGGVMRAGERILRPLRDAVGAVAPRATVREAEVRPVWGAVLLALACLEE